MAGWNRGLTAVSARLPPATAALSRAFSSAAVSHLSAAVDEPAGSLFAPTAEHAALRSLCASFVRDEVEPQALQYNREERFNHALFKKAGALGLLGVTVDPEYGGAGMDATAACIVHEELSSSDPAFCLSYLAHSQLFINNLARNGTAAQKAAWLPAACSGEAIGGMGMSEPDYGTDVLGAAPHTPGCNYVNCINYWNTHRQLHTRHVRRQLHCLHVFGDQRERRLEGWIQ